jgi:hypothetical protein
VIGVVVGRGVGGGGGGENFSRATPGTLLVQSIFLDFFLSPLFGHQPRRGRSPLISSHMDAHSVRR